MNSVVKLSPSPLRPLISQFPRLLHPPGNLGASTIAFSKGRLRLQKSWLSSHGCLVRMKKSSQYKQKRDFFSFVSPAAKAESSNGHRDDELRNGGRIPMPTRQNSSTRNNGQNHNPSYINSLEVELRELLNSPIGSFRPSTWLQAQRALQYLCEHRHDIPRAFSILDRLVQEPDSRRRITNDMVYTVVKQWLNLYIKQQKQLNYNKQYAHPRQLQAKSSGRTGNDNGVEPSVPNPLAVWRRIDSYQRSGIPMDSFTYHRIIEGTSHAKSKKPNNPHGPLLAETILDRMMVESKQNPLLRPCAITFTYVIFSWQSASANCPAIAVQEAPQKALALLQTLKTLYETNWGQEFLPTKQAYRSVMKIFAHTGDADQVEALLEELYISYLDHSEDYQQRQNQPSMRQHYEDLLLPTTSFFSLVLFAWSKSSDPLAAERAEAILDRMLELEATGEIPNIQVTAFCFNIVMICYSRRRTEEAALKVQSLYDRLMEYHRGYGNCAIGDSDDTNPKRPVSGTYLAMITAWAWFNPAMAERYFWEWKDAHERGDCPMRAGSGVLRTVVAGWYNASTTETEAAERIDRLVQFAFQNKSHLEDRYPTAEPTAAIVNMAISAWCRKTKKDGVQRAEELLYQMQTYHEVNPQSDMKCTVWSYLPIVKSLATLGRMERAEELLMEYITLHKKPVQEHAMRRHASDGGHKNPVQEHAMRRHASDGGGDTDSSDVEGDGLEHGNTRIFNTVLKGWLSKASVHPEAAVRAEDLLLSMKSAGSRPNAASFRYVLDAWRKSVKRINVQHIDQRHNHRAPQVDKVLALFDQERRKGRLGGNEELHLILRQGWALLAV